MRPIFTALISAELISILISAGALLSAQLDPLKFGPGQPTSAVQGRICLRQGKAVVRPRKPVLVGSMTKKCCSGCAFPFSESYASQEALEFIEIRTGCTCMSTKRWPSLVTTSASSWSPCEEHGPCRHRPHDRGLQPDSHTRTVVNSYSFEIWDPFQCTVLVPKFESL